MVAFSDPFFAFSVLPDCTITMAICSRVNRTCTNNLYFVGTEIQGQSKDNVNASNIYSRQNHESLQLEEWPIVRAHHSFLPCYCCSGDVGHILDDSVIQKPHLPVQDEV